MDLIFLLPPIVGALVGFVTNVIAVELLFHPKKPIRILNFKLQGLVPARSKEIIERFMDSLSEILNEKDFEFVIDRAVTRSYRESIKNRAHNGLFSFLERYTSISKKIDEWIESNLVSYIKDMVTKNISRNVDIKEFVMKKAEEISDEQIEDLFKKFAKKELRFIEVSGALIGFIIGSMQSIVFYLLY
ncbi:DUF445 domain-containing protein [Archaeoglobales archaeon]|nr:MAG: DUF445 domain-containing protein [Archaeoglobales archaeon]